MGITEEKFRELYEKYKNLVFRQVYDMTSDYYLAQDICQETFLKLYGYMGRLDERGVKRCCMWYPTIRPATGFGAARSTTS